jgi:hypothetical protein
VQGIPGVPGVTGPTGSTGPTGPSLQPDWSQAVTTALDFIKNKPFVPIGLVLLQHIVFEPSAKKAFDFNIESYIVYMFVGTSQRAGTFVGFAAGQIHKDASIVNDIVGSGAEDFSIVDGKYVFENTSIQFNAEVSVYKFNLPH